MTVYNLTDWVPSGMSIAEIIDDFSELAKEDIRACLEFAIDHNQLRYNF
ncbi:DUF433 domain-containing protein [Dapis sp. BLCC M126]